MNLKTINCSPTEIAVKYANELWNDKNISAIDQYVHPDVHIHSPLGDFHGAKALKKIAHAWLKGFPDLQVANENIITENDLISIQWHAQGTHQGEFKGKEPRGNIIKYSGVTIYRIKNDQITEYWAYIDMNHLLNQL